MKQSRFPTVLFWLALAAIVAYSSLAVAGTLTESVVLVASSRQEGSLYDQTVVIVTALPDGSHFGFILNRPTRFEVQTLFPKDEAASKVKERVSFGGPTSPTAVFAVTRSDVAADGQLQLAPGLVVALDPAAVEAVMRDTPSDARYFLGLMAWEPDELEQEIAQSMWELHHADANLVFGAASGRGLWSQLRAPMAGLSSRWRLL